MASRPRHEALRGLVTELLREGFGARFSDLEHERYLVDNSGRIDVAWGATVIELKTDLRREEGDVEARMPDYLRGPKWLRWVTLAFTGIIAAVLTSKTR